MYKRIRKKNRKLHKFTSKINNDEIKCFAEQNDFAPLCNGLMSYIFEAVKKKIKFIIKEI